MVTVFVDEVKFGQLDSKMNGRHIQLIFNTLEQ